MASLNLAESWTKISASLLVLYGTSDFITAEADHERIVEIVNKRKAGAASLVAINGMTTWTQPDPLNKLTSFASSKGLVPYDERFSGAIADWLCKRDRCDPPS